MAGTLTEAAASAQDAAQRAGTSIMTERANILIVDDRPDKHVVLSAILDELGQNLVHVTSGEDALKHVLRHEFAVILLDVNMPGLDGLETAALIRRRKRSAHVPIIFITADYGDEARVAQGYALGAVDFMVSPIVPEILRSKVKVFVELFLLARLAQRQAEDNATLAAERAARAAAERANLRSTFMANASAALGRSLAVTAASRELPRLAIPFLADVSALTLRREDGIEARTELAWSDPDPAVGLHTESVPAVDCTWWRSAIERVIAGGRGERLDEISPGRTGTASDAGDREPLEVPRGTPITSLIIVPLSARGRTLGAFSLGLGPSGRTFQSEDVATAADLANRAAMALDNALLYGRIREHDRRKNEFLAMLAHELRNPLTPITNALYIMDQQGVDPEKQAWARNVMVRQVRLLGRLVDDLLDVSRITQGKIALRIEDVEVSEVVAAAVETARPLIDARQHRFTMTVPGKSLRVRGDFARLAQILANLLNNAAKYTEPKGGIQLSVTDEGASVVFRVRDSGMGIPAAALSSIFDLFAQAERTLDRSEGGLGIGLTLVKRLVEMQGGTVSAHSEGHDLGSEFTVRMPAAVTAVVPAAAPASASPSSPASVPASVPASAPASAPASVPASVPASAPAREPAWEPGPRAGTRPPSPTAGETRILVVDDNRDAAQSMAVLLRMEGHVVDIAYDGPTALEAVGSMRPHAVLLDLGLPGMDGFELAARLRSLPDGAQTMLIAISGYGQDQHKEKSRRAGFDRHFVKPIDPTTITVLLAEQRRSGARPTMGNVVASCSSR